MKWLNTRCTIAETIKDGLMGGQSVTSMLRYVHISCLIFISAFSFKWTTEFREIS